MVTEDLNLPMWEFSN